MKTLLTKLNEPKVAGQLRHLATALGPLIAMLGIADETTWQIAAGVVLALVGFLGSWFAPEKKR